MANIVFIGDSHMQGLKPRLERLLPSIPGLRLLHIEARPGWSARRYARSGDVERLARGANVVVFELGGNDASAGISPGEHAADVRRLIMQAQPAKVIWIAPGVTEIPDLEANRALLKPVQKKLVNAADGIWIDGHDLTSAEFLRADRVHYSAAGYDAYARAIFTKLMDLMKGTSTPGWVIPLGLGAAAVGAFFIIRGLYVRQVDGVSRA